MFSFNKIKQAFGKIGFLTFLLLASIVSFPIFDVGAILLDLQQTANTDSFGIALFLGFGNAASVLSCFFAAPIVAKYGNNVGLTVSLLLKGIPILLICYVPLPFMICLYCLYSLGKWINALASTKLCYDLGGERYGSSFLQIYFIWNSISFLVDPAIEKPFLSELISVNTPEDAGKSNMSSTWHPLHKVYEPTRLYIPLTACGVISIILGLFWLGISKCVKKDTIQCDQHEYSTINNNSHLKMVKFYRILSVIGTSITSTFGHGHHALMSNLLVYILVNSHHGLRKSQAISIMLSYCMSYLCARVSGVGLALIARPLFIFFAAGIGTSASAMITLFFINYSSGILWFFAVSMGFFGGFCSPALSSYICSSLDGDIALLASLEYGYSICHLIFPIVFIKLCYCFDAMDPLTVFIIGCCISALLSVTSQAITTKVSNEMLKLKTNEVLNSDDFKGEMSAN